MKGYFLTLVTLFTVSSCSLLAGSNLSPEEALFAEKIKVFAESVESLYKSFIEDLASKNKTEEIERYRQITGVSQQTQIKMTKSIKPTGFDKWVGNLLKKFDADDELKAKISEKLFEFVQDKTGEVFAEKILFGNQKADHVSFFYLMGIRDQTTQRTTVAYGFVNAQVDIKEKILIQETDTGDIKEQQVVVKPEDFNEDDMKAIYLLCEYTAVQRLKNFFFH